MNKQKIINDPLYGLISIPSELIFDLIEHPVFQRMRRIKQLGLTDYVYPGASHTRFHHAIGAMHLMSLALQNLRNKGIHISDQEYEASLVAILLHDIGHGPFSHTLEYSLLTGIHHEQLSLLIIHYLNETDFKGKLGLALKIFQNEYHRKFFHQLVSSQLDVDRLDYLSRDSFYTGVSEGTVGVDRIIQMINIHQDQLIVEEKGIYSIENFLSARRLMYWQVYFHKTTVGMEKMLVNLINRAKSLAQSGPAIAASNHFRPFLEQEVTIEHFVRDQKLLDAFMALDDYDVWSAIKNWSSNDDLVLSRLSHMILDRKLYKVKLSNTAFEIDKVEYLKNSIIKKLGIGQDLVHYFLVTGTMSNAAYIAGGENINILTKDGEVIDIAKASDLPNIKAMSKIVKKYYLCWPKSLSL
ncbi:MAG: HD domain-containing protein [Candidatus Cyclobacteriaceae bacterium M3_2C_046]